MLSGNFLVLCKTKLLLLRLVVKKYCIQDLVVNKEYLESPFFCSRLCLRQKHNLITNLLIPDKNIHKNKMKHSEPMTVPIDNCNIYAIKHDETTQLPIGNYNLHTINRYCSQSFDYSYLFQVRLEKLLIQNSKTCSLNKPNFTTLVTKDFPSKYKNLSSNQIRVV